MVIGALEENQAEENGEYGAACHQGLSQKVTFEKGPKEVREQVMGLSGQESSCTEGAKVQRPEEHGKWT